ncbi:unnamed protein product, partial [Sphagnum jensenii]
QQQTMQMTTREGGREREKERKKERKEKRKSNKSAAQAGLGQKTERRFSFTAMFPDVVAPVPAPSAEDGGVIFVLEKASLEVAKVGKVKKTKEIPSPFLFGEEGGEFFFRGSCDRDVHNEGDYKGD